MKRVVLLVILMNASAYGMLGRSVNRLKRSMTRVVHSYHVQHILPTLQKRNHRRYETKLFDVQKKMLVTKLVCLQNKHISSPFWHGIAGFSFFAVATIIPYIDFIDPLFKYPATFIGMWCCHKALQNKDKIKEINENIDLVKKQLTEFEEVEKTEN